MYCDVKDSELVPGPRRDNSYRSTHCIFFNHRPSWELVLACFPPFVCIHYIFLLSLLKLCSQCLGASLPPPDVILPGLLPLMPRHTPLKGKNVGGGLQNMMHGHDILPYGNEEAHFQRTFKSDYGIVCFSLEEIWFLKKSTVDEQLAVLCSSRLLNSIIIDDYVTNTSNQHLLCEFLIQARSISRVM